MNGASKQIYKLTMTLNLRNLTSVSAQLSLEACHIIKNTLFQGKTVTYSKGEDDLVTETDFHVQTLLSTGIKKHFPTLKVIGEETRDYDGDINYDYDSLKSDILPKSSKICKRFESEDLCLWIDPIDCTWGFINGNVQDVTVLMGVTYKGVPILGVIGTPFKLIQGKKVFEPVVTIGSAIAQETYDFNGTNWMKKQAPTPSENFRLVMGSMEQTEAQKKSIEGLGAMNIKAGGSGRKIMMVANGQAQAMLMLNSYTHKWDTCAGQAIIKSLGGQFTTPSNTNIAYNPSISDTTNKEGMIVAMNPNVHQKCVSALVESRTYALI